MRAQNKGVETETEVSAVRRLKNLIGMPVVCRRQKIGRLIQADLSTDLTRMEGVWIDGGLTGTRYISSEHLSMIGKSVILADSRGSRRRTSVHPLLRRAVSTDGRRIGAIVGAQIDEISFLVCTLELSRGFWDDLWYGRLQIRDFNARGAEIIVPVWTQQTGREGKE